MNQHSRLCSDLLLAPTTHSLSLSSAHKCFRHSLHTIASKFRRGTSFLPIFFIFQTFGHNVLLDIPRHPINDIEPASRTEFAGFEGKDAFNDVDRHRRASLRSHNRNYSIWSKFPKWEENESPSSDRPLPPVVVCTTLVVLWVVYHCVPKCTFVYHSGCTVVVCTTVGCCALLCTISVVVVGCAQPLPSYVGIV